ncbi:hypothetical protein HZA55_00265, partial [Candidatus Poribacteria bacterium]|nr:hypothetical protein [Candidatus Poribacteria bacterium]
LIRLKTEKKISLILTTHYMEEAEFLCERIIIMDKGKIIAEGQLEKLLSDHSNSETLKCRKMTLDDLFISMTGRHLHQ